jgi:dTDP-4-dehydrorhamnose reductase
MRRSRRREVLVLGGDGMLGHKAFEVLGRRFETWATFRDSSGPWRDFPQYREAAAGRLLTGVDATRVESVAAALERARPDAVVNAVGIVKQLKEARDAVLSVTVNALFPHQLAALCEEAGVRMVHVSTDCVFSGRKGMYTEDDVPDPVDLYGRSKLLGEVDRPGALTLRTSIVGRDFLKSSALLEWFLSNRGGRVNGFRNAVYSGLTTQALAHVIGELLDRHPSLNGLWHVAGAPITKYDLLRMVREAMGLDIEIVPFDDPPCDRSLDATRFAAATGLTAPSWEEMVSGLAADPTPYDAWRQAHAAAQR